MENVWNIGFQIYQNQQLELQTHEWTQFPLSSSLKLYFLVQFHFIYVL
jgi:hypothetical protein